MNDEWMKSMQGLASAADALSGVLKKEPAPRPLVGVIVYRVEFFCSACGRLLSTSAQERPTVLDFSIALNTWSGCCGAMESVSANPMALEDARTLPPTNRKIVAVPRPEVPAPPAEEKPTP